MTYSAVPALRVDPEIAAEWEPRLIAGALCGMAMTEKQGGSDVRANTTRAEPVGDGWFELTGHKWFCSYPPCDIFLVLAQAPAGLSCFVLERGAGMEFQRLKDKLGTRSLPSSEVEFRGAPARLLGEEGRGVATIIEMVTHTRLDCVIGSAAGDAPRRRRGDLARAPPLARSARGWSTSRRWSTCSPTSRWSPRPRPPPRCGSRAPTTRATRALRRFATAIAKYWVCKRATPHAAESLECLGGNGYVEESPMPRLLRDAPLNGIWEGSGNVIALDVLRALAREPRGPRRLPWPSASWRAAATRGSTPTSTRCRRRSIPWSARRAVEELAVAFQASLLVRHAPAFVADAFCAARLGGGGRVYGTLPRGRRRRGDRRPRPTGRLTSCSARGGSRAARRARGRVALGDGEAERAVRARSARSSTARPVPG